MSWLYDANPISLLTCCLRLLGGARKTRGDIGIAHMVDFLSASSYSRQLPQHFFILAAAVHFYNSR